MDLNRKAAPDCILSDEKLYCPPPTPPPSLDDVFSSLPTPVPSPPLDEPDGLMSSLFLDIIKVTVSEILVGGHLAKNCPGSEINDPSQRHHPFLFEPPKYFFI